MVLFAQFIPLLISAIAGVAKSQQAGAAKSAASNSSAQRGLSAAIQGVGGGQPTGAEQDPLKTLNPEDFLNEAQDVFNSSFLNIS